MLQMVKTFAALFFVLSIVNLPIYIIYSEASETSFLGSLFSLNFKHMTLGSLGHREKSCSNSHLLDSDVPQDHQFDGTLHGVGHQKTGPM